MKRYLATPHMYGAELRIRSLADFKRDYGEQARDDDRFVLAPTSETTLKKWAQSCLGLGGYDSLHQCAGWSPFRSGVVNLQRKGAAYFYKRGDNNSYDFTAATAPQDFPLQPWLETLDKFVRICLALHVQATRKSVLSPVQVVRKVLYGEWASAGDDFTVVLMRNNFHPTCLDSMLDAAWSRMIRLPTPRALMFTQDQKVQVAFLALASEREHPKGLRV